MKHILKFIGEDRNINEAGMSKKALQQSRLEGELPYEPRSESYFKLRHIGNEVDRKRTLDAAKLKWNNGKWKDYEDFRMNFSDKLFGQSFLTKEQGQRVLDYAIENIQHNPKIQRCGKYPSYQEHINNRGYYNISDSHDDDDLFTAEQQKGWMELHDYVQDILAKTNMGYMNPSKEAWSEISTICRSINIRMAFAAVETDYGRVLKDKYVVNRPARVELTDMITFDFDRMWSRLDPKEYPKLTMQQLNNSSAGISNNAKQEMIDYMNDVIANDPKVGYEVTGLVTFAEYFMYIQDILPNHFCLKPKQLREYENLIAKLEKTEKGDVKEFFHSVWKAFCYERMLEGYTEHLGPYKDRSWMKN